MAVLGMAEGEKRDAYQVLARFIMAEYGLIRLPEILRSDKGKPYFPRETGLHFNLSHSGGYILCGVGERPIGVDVESIRPRRDGLPSRVLDQREYTWFQERGSRWADFYTLWTLKESRVKCEGQGLNRPPRNIAVPLLEVGQYGEWEGFGFRAYGGEIWRASACMRGVEPLPTSILNLS